VKCSTAARSGENAGTAADADDLETDLIASPLTAEKPTRRGKRPSAPAAAPGAAAAVHVGAGNGGGGAGAAVAGRPAVRPSLAALLTSHILHDGEMVLLILRPSLWFIVFGSLRFLAAVIILVIAAKLRMPTHAVRVAELGTFLLAGRIMWAVLQWTGRLYVLTDMRIVRLSGVFTVDVFDCPLRKVAEARLTSTLRERLLRVGSIEIVPQDETCPPGDWRTVARPEEVLRKINATIERAKQGGPHCHV
jgi:hypothetical protein